MKIYHIFITFFLFCGLGSIAAPIEQKDYGQLPWNYGQMSWSSCDSPSLSSRKPGSLSYVYYPTATGGLCGHSELEVNGAAWTWCYKSMAPRSFMLGDKPCFRFKFKADESDINSLEDNLNNDRKGLLNCAKVAAEPLREANICSIPFPFNYLPSLSAAYLMAGYQLGLNNVQAVEYYGERPMRESLAIMAPGAAVETWAVLIGAGTAAVTTAMCGMTAVAAAVTCKSGLRNLHKSAQRFVNYMQTKKA